MFLRKMIVTTAFTVLGLLSGFSAHATQGVSDQEIVIGMHTALSGPAQLWGTGSVNAIRLHFKDINATGGIHGRKLRLVVEDHQYQVPRAIQAVNKLIHRDKIFAMLAALGAPMNNAVLKRQLAKGIPNMFPYTASRSMISPFHRLKFTGLTTYYEQARTSLRYFMKNKGKKNICLMYQGTDYGQELLEGVQDELKSVGSSLVAKASHKPTDTDFMTSVLKLRKAKCDLVVLGTIIGDTIRIVATARKLGWDVDFVGTVASYDQIVIDKAPKGSMEGYYATTTTEIMYEDTATGEGKSFMESYKKEYGKNAGNSAQLAYSYARLLTTGLKNAGKDLTLDSFISGMESIRDYKDPMGGPLRNITSKKHNAVDHSMLAQVQQGRWATVAGPL